MDVSENSGFSTQIIHLSFIHSGLPLLLKTHPFWGAKNPVDANLHNRESGQKLGKSLPWQPPQAPRAVAAHGVFSLRKVAGCNEKGKQSREQVLLEGNNLILVSRREYVNKWMFPKMMMFSPPKSSMDENRGFPL